MAKHVIFLGAGASYTSGYPLAAELRVIFSSPGAFQNYITSKLNDSALTADFFQRFKEYEKMIHLFREGGFGTIDEFSFLSRGRFRDGVQILKWFMSLIFALHNPEIPYPKSRTHPNDKTTAFEYSDYFPFIQKLFNKEYHELRDDVAILTYNYDPYLEFVLDRAYTTRKTAAAVKGWRYDSTNFFSGLSDRKADVLLERPGFCFLKLHGTSVLKSFSPSDWQGETALLHEDVFLRRQDLIEKLKRKKRQATEETPIGVDKDIICAPPIFFPWEILKEDGEFVTEADFRSFEGKAGSTDTRFSGGSFYSVFKVIWQRAQKEIIDAEKISFVGLSMHEFLKPGLRFLFKERIRKFKTSTARDVDSNLEIILACPSAWSPGETFRSLPRPNSPAAKLASMLSEVNPEMARKEKGLIYSHNSGKNAVGGIVCYDNFKNFIEAEM
jgi:hypothetical protein